MRAGGFRQRAATCPEPQTPSLAKTGLERNVDNDVLTNSSLELKLYGATSKEIQIAPTTPNNRQDLQVDPANRLVGDELEAQWNRA